MSATPEIDIRIGGKLGENIRVQRCAAEVLSNSDAIAAWSVDLITAAGVVGVSNTPSFTAKFAKLLRTGATLAIWLYGRPIFAEHGQAKSWHIYDKITASASDRVRPFKGTHLERASTYCSGWLDSVAFSEAE